MVFPSVPEPPEREPPIRECEECGARLQYPGEPHYHDCSKLPRKAGPDSVCIIDEDGELLNPIPDEGVPEGLDDE